MVEFAYLAMVLGSGAVTVKGFTLTASNTAVDAPEVLLDTFIAIWMFPLGNE
jgi:hypothetical protein